MATTCVTYVQPALPKYRVPVYRELASRPGIDFRLLYGEEPDLANAEPDGFRAEPRRMRMLGPKLREVRWHQAQLEAVRDPAADVVCLSWNPRYASLPIALRIARRRGVGTLLWGHGYSKAESRLRKLVRDQIGGQATALLFYDQQTAARAIEDGFDPSAVFTAPNAIDQTPIQQAAAPWRADPGQLAAWRDEQGLAGKRVLLCVTRLAPKNRLDLAIEALRDVAASHDAVLALVGKGDEQRDRLAQLATQRGVDDRVRFLGPIYDEATLAPWFLASDLFVYPANIGLSLLHALGYGLPVVTTDNREVQNPEIVAFDPGRNGATYRDGDAADLAATIARLLSDEGERSRLADGAQQTVASGYNVPAMVDGMVEAIAYCRDHR